jgi:KDO2-lipid IV(A) lauroyltransferase
VSTRTSKRPSGRTAADWLANLAIRAALAVMLALPYGLRLRLAATIMTRIVAPLAGWRRRIRQNLALVMPDLPPAEVARITRAVPANMGRTLVEIYSGPEFVARIRDLPLTGPGAEALRAAHAAGRGVMLVTGHIGNYDAIRGRLIAEGLPVGGLYKRMGNRYFNDHYVRAIGRIGTPLFPRDRQGLAEMIRFLKSGGMVGLVLDQAMHDAPMIDFMGQPAHTSLSAAEMALRYDALVVPCYGLRRADGGFDLVFEAPVPHGTALEMTEALNASLEAQVRAHPGQWMWTHRRWKTDPPRRRRRLR